MSQKLQNCRGARYCSNSLNNNLSNQIRLKTFKATLAILDQLRVELQNYRLWEGFRVSK